MKDSFAEWKSIIVHEGIVTIAADQDVGKYIGLVRILRLASAQK